MEPTNARGETQADRHVARHLRERGIRFTPGRRRVVGVLAGASGPSSAAELHEALKGRVPLSSLYRTLAVLEEAGVLDRLHDVNGVARYELSEWLAGHHHHVVCMECGTSRDVELGAGLETTMAQLARAVAEDLQFQMSGHRLELEGVCPSCRS